MELCAIEGCTNSVAKRGWCQAHYHRWYRHGDPLAGGTPKRELQRFLNEVALPYRGDECLVWPYSTNGVGYGQIRQGYKKLSVHRIICDAVNGPAPSEKHEVAHNCGNGHLGCCAPNHLRWATRIENRADIKIHGPSRLRLSI